MLIWFLGFSLFQGFLFGFAPLAVQTACLVGMPEPLAVAFGVSLGCVVFLGYRVDKEEVKVLKNQRKPEKKKNPPGFISL